MHVNVREKTRVQGDVRADSTTDTIINGTATHDSISRITDKIVSIAKFIHNAKKHVRGSKTSDFLKEASGSMNDLLKILNIEQGKIYNRSVYEPRSVCSEEFMGTLYGAPFFYKGFETNVCNYSTPIWELVTFVKYFNFQKTDIQKSNNEIEIFLSSVYKFNVNVHVIVGLNLSITHNFRSKYPTLNLVDSKGKSDGTVLNNLISEVKTPYVLLARNSEFLTQDVRLERLVREIEQLNVTVAGGAFRNADGHWKKGCFQAMYRNFTLKYLEGYDESFHECLFCDYILGPFVTTKHYLKENQFYSLNENEGLFEEWFLRVSQARLESVVCPDSMFHVQLQYESNIKWDKFMRKWNIHKCVPPTGLSMVEKYASYRCEFKASKAIPPGNLQYNANAVKIVMNICEEAGIICELQEGTALGAVKLEKTLPWERDVDLTFLTANYSSIMKLKSTFQKKGFGFTALDERWCCVDNITAGGQFQMRYLGWNIELYGQHKMDTEILIKEGIKPTKVLLDGQWVNVPRNPGLFVRNRYGREMYQHAEHWMETGDSDGWINYKTNVFKQCTKQGDHDCLDRYNADGDLPFIEILP
ncbi:uncharacterized protein LOC123558814 [Mercenaria mercenaria]|uniref:uncharacterized protein LOC123558814 n=1 Tax=Mercenaria mercenaria TaxID=6596 RepID=UPI00234F04EF|nr:uncharacterized protein LOC123558814 [Mercenaria mercenaria]